jgi:hypothetical protein
MKFVSNNILNSLKYSGYYITLSALTMECYILFIQCIYRYSRGSQTKECIFDYRTDRLTFVIELQYYYCKARTGILNITQIISCFKELNSQHIWTAVSG